MFLTSLVAFAAIAAAGDSPARLKNVKAVWDSAFQCKLLDIHARIYPDNYAGSGPAYQMPDAPRNYTLGIQLAINSAGSQHFEIHMDSLKNGEGTLFPGTLTFRQLLPVHIEANTRDYQSEPGVPTYPSWVPKYLIRTAPFDVLEVVSDVAGDTLTVGAGNTSGILLRLFIPSGCPTGIYRGNITVTGSLGAEVTLPVSFAVHKIVINENDLLNSVHWLSSLPENLKSGASVEWWSEDHWKLLERAGKLFRETGDNVMYTPLVDYPMSGVPHPLIRSLWNSNTKEMSFDFSRLDRWMQTFDTLGFKYFSGRHIKNMGANLKVIDVISGDTLAYSGAEIKMDRDCFRQVFLKALNSHLQSIGMLNRYIQHIYDEPWPEVVEEYRQYYSLLQKTMPGVKSIDAFTRGADVTTLFSDLSDIQVMNIYGITQLANSTVKKRMQQNKETWLYNTVGPKPPLPNRHLDQPLTLNRLWPWLCMKYNASGYLYWAANEYRGVTNEYLASIGPYPEQNNYPIGYPPGDNWFYYRTSNGLVPSMRILSYREGLVDAFLLTNIKKTNAAKFQDLLSKVIFPEFEPEQQKGYEDSPVKFNIFRKEMLDYLDTF